VFFSLSPHHNFTATADSIVNMGNNTNKEFSDASSTQDDNTLPFVLGETGISSKGRSRLEP
jgi:hypothetical protein